MMSRRRSIPRAMLVPVLMAMLAVAGCSGIAGQGKSELVRVPEDAATITEAVEQVAIGGMVLVSPGTYPEQVTIDVEGVTLRGTDRNQVVIDGGGTRDFGVVVTANGVRVQNLTVHSSLFYGVLVTGVHDESGPLAHGGPGYEELDTEKFPPLQRFAVESVTAYNNALYGIYAFNAQHGVITDSYASGSADSGFYVGQCVDCDILVARNVAERNAIGFENANASDSVMIAGNRFSGNRIGMTLISNYQEAFTPQQANLVVGNVIVGNDSADSPEHALGGFGIGVGINGGRDNVLVDNRIEGNPLAGLTLNNTEDLAATGNEIRGGTLLTNGVDYVDISADRAPSSGNCISGVQLGTVSPEVLRAECPSGNARAGASDVPALEAPKGMSFLEVPAPIDQPSMSVDDRVPEALPDTITFPDQAEFPFPDTDYLAERSGTR